MKDFVVFVGLNKAYIDVFHLFLSSYIRNSGIADSDFYIFTDDVEEEDIKIVFNFTLVKINNAERAQGINSENKVWIKASSFRLDGFSYLRTKYERGLYLDVDVIINGDISELKRDFNEDVCVVTDIEYYDHSKEIFNKRHFNIIRCKDREMVYSKKYFNAGVMLLNFRTLADFDFVSAFIESMTEHIYKYSDQDFLNIYFLNKNVKFLSTTYNAKINNLLRNFGETEAIMKHKKKIAESKIIHFIGIKPWVRRNIQFSFFLSLQWPIEVIYREYEYVKDIVSDDFNESIAAMNADLVIPINAYIAQYNAYRKKLGLS